MKFVASTAPTEKALSGVAARSAGEPIVKEIESFLDSVRSGQRPIIDAEAGLANVRTAQRIVEAIRESLPKSMATR